MKTQKQLCGALMLAGALVAALAPAEAAQRLDVTQLAANKADTSARSKTIQQIKSTPPRRKSRCYG
jgi:hypothetical protein